MMEDSLALNQFGSLIPYSQHIPIMLLKLNIKKVSNDLKCFSGTVS